MGKQTAPDPAALLARLNALRVAQGRAESDAASHKKKLDQHVKELRELGAVGSKLSELLASAEALAVKHEKAAAAAHAKAEALIAEAEAAIAECNSEQEIEP